ncbi:MAG: hypothetical protein H6978_11615 [Gammaproteobacteria bacterium]|nr:hypothetical protein [Gammaproteobacteria bacterium]
MYSANSMPNSSPMDAIEEQEENAVARTEALANAAHRRIEDAAEAAYPFVERLTEQAHNAVDRMAGAATSTADGVAEKATDAKLLSDQVVADCSAYMQKNPLKALGIAVATGFLVSRILRI